MFLFQVSLLSYVGLFAEVCMSLFQASGRFMLKIDIWDHDEGSRDEHVEYLYRNIVIKPSLERHNQSGKSVMLSRRTRCRYEFHEHVLYMACSNFTSILMLLIQIFTIRNFQTLIHMRAFRIYYNFIDFITTTRYEIICDLLSIVQKRQRTTLV